MDWPDTQLWLELHPKATSRRHRGCLDIRIARQSLQINKSGFLHSIITKDECVRGYLLFSIGAMIEWGWKDMRLNADKHDRWWWWWRIWQHDASYWLNCEMLRLVHPKWPFFPCLLNIQPSGFCSSDENLTTQNSDASKLSIKKIYELSGLISLLKRYNHFIWWTDFI